MIDKENYKTEKETLEKRLQSLQRQEEKIENRLHILSFQEQIELVKRCFSEIRYGYYIIITKGSTFDINTKYITELNKTVVTFILPDSYISKIMEWVESAAINEISK